MSDHRGMFEPQPLNDGRRPFHGKAPVERRNTENGTRHAPRSYGTVAAQVAPTTKPKHTTSKPVWNT